MEFTRERYLETIWEEDELFVPCSSAATVAAGYVLHLKTSCCVPSPPIAGYSMSSLKKNYGQKKTAFFRLSSSSQFIPVVFVLIAQRSNQQLGCLVLLTSLSFALSWPSREDRFEPSGFSRKKNKEKNKNWRKKTLLKNTILILEEKRSVINAFLSVLKTYTEEIKQPAIQSGSQAVTGWDKVCLSRSEWERRRRKTWLPMSSQERSNAVWKWKLREKNQIASPIYTHTCTKIASSSPLLLRGGRAGISITYAAAD